MSATLRQSFAGKPNAVIFLQLDGLQAGHSIAVLVLQAGEFKEAGLIENISRMLQLFFLFSYSFSNYMFLMYKLPF